MLKKILLTLIVSIFIIPSLLSAHCEIPCGIYADKMRIDMLNEHITTIEKSMKRIVRIESSPTVNYNQLVRWINNKDQHANHLQEIVTQYFMTQRVKLIDSNDKKALQKYQTELALLHTMLIYAMKTKQTNDLEYCNKLREAVNEFYDVYFTEEEKNHHHKN